MRLRASCVGQLAFFVPFGQSFCRKRRGGQIGIMQRSLQCEEGKEKRNENGSEQGAHL